MLEQVFSKMLLFWLLWIVCTCTGAVFLSMLYLVIGPYLLEHALPIFLIVIPLLSAIIGIAQWLLRRWLPNALWWIPASIPGGLILVAVMIDDRTNLFTWQDLPHFFSPLAPYPIFLTWGVGFLAGCCQSVSCAWELAGRLVRP
ncbi:hypothetical protein [Reticulibacter mediterranei]|uniref:hypothetical protein n=1 Tax=Reticulibacter mediterranei TaxID=2778369 RepID=UPI003570FFC3